METQTKSEEQTIILNKEAVGRIARLGRDGKCISLDRQFSVFNGMQIGDLVQVTVNIVKRNVGANPTGKGLRADNVQKKNPQSWFDSDNLSGVDLFDAFKGVHIM